MGASTKALQRAPDSAVQPDPARRPDPAALRARSLRMVASMLVVAAALAGCEQDAAPAAQTLVLGQRVYEAQCAACHGARLEGQPDWRTRLPSGRLPAPPHDASGHTWHHTGPVLFGIVKHGVQAYAPPGYESDMPAYGGLLSDSEIWAVLSYIKSTWPAEIQRRHDALEQADRRR